MIEICEKQIINRLKSIVFINDRYPFIPNTAVFGPTNFIGTTTTTTIASIASTARMKISRMDEDFFTDDFFTDFCTDEDFSDG